MILITKSLTLVRRGEARKSLAIFSGLIVRKVIQVRRLIFKVCHQLI
jgi:hypothetical protein